MTTRCPFVASTGMLVVVLAVTICVHFPEAIAESDAVSEASSHATASTQLEVKLTSSEGIPSFAHADSGRVRLLAVTDFHDSETLNPADSEHLSVAGQGDSSVHGRALASAGGLRYVGQKNVLMAIKEAWGGNFVGADTWQADNKLSSFHGVTTDSYGLIIGLALPSSGVSGPFPALMGNLTGLTSIDLQGNALKGGIPAHVLQRLPRLTRLLLNGNLLTGCFPWAELAGRSLSQLDIFGNQLTGVVPPSLFASMPRLQRLSIGGGNRFPGPIPNRFNSTLLQYVDLSGCQFTGAIPPSLATLSSLADIDLSGNQLTGPFPTSLARLPNLVHLNLAHNRLSGRLPATFSSGPSLRSLKVAGNFLTGPLPAFPRLSQGCPASDAPNCYFVMVVFDFSNNYFTGPPTVAIPLPRSPAFPSPSAVCPQRTGTAGCLRLQGNCLATVPGCRALGQRSASQCTQFCGTGSQAGQCGGHGVCVPQFPPNSSASKPPVSCTCDRGYEVCGQSKQQCRKKAR